MNPSNRINELSDLSGGAWEVFEKSKELINSGVDVIELSIGEHDVKTDHRILNAMNRSALDGNTGYAPVRGNDTLRKEIAERVSNQTKVKTSFKNVIVTPGGQAALFAAHMAVCDHGDIALYCDPYYATYPGTIKGVNAIPKTVKARAEDNFQLSESAIDAAGSNAKSLLINSPNNPTGVIYTRQTLEGISAACKKNNLWLISDEVYNTQVWNSKHISPRSLDGMEERTIVIGSMSKSHAMTGSRIGWAIAPEELIEHMINLATHTTYGVPGFIQDAALYALRLGKKIEQEISEPFRRRQKIATQILSTQNILKLVPPSGAMYLMLDVRDTGLNGISFSKSLLEEQFIAVMPGESFGESASGHIRIAMTVKDEMFSHALNKIIAFSKSKKNKKDSLR